MTLGRPYNNQRKLSKAKIVNRATKHLVKLGKFPTMRALAIELESDPMAIYHYFDSKQALIAEVGNSIAKQLYKIQKDLPWQLNIYQLSYSYLVILEQYDGLLEYWLQGQDTHLANAFIECYLGAIEPLALEKKVSMDGLNLLVDYLHGLARAKQNDKLNQLARESIKGPLKIWCAGLEALTLD